MAEPFATLFIGGVIGWAAEEVCGFLKVRGVEGYVNGLLRNEVLEEALETALQRAARDVYKNWRLGGYDGWSRRRWSDEARRARKCLRYLCDQAGRIIRLPEARMDDGTLRRLLGRPSHERREEAQLAQTETRDALWRAVEPYTRLCPDDLCSAYREHLMPRVAEWLRELVRQDGRLRDTIFLDLIKTVEAGGVRLADQERVQLQETFLAGLDSRFVVLAATQHQMVDALHNLTIWQDGMRSDLADLSSQLVAIGLRLDGLPQDVVEALDDHLRRREEEEHRRRELAYERVVNSSVRLDVRDSFHDRADEMEWLREQLAESSARLIAVVGRGGYGKTALVTSTVIEAETGPLRVDGRELPVYSVAYFEPDGTGVTLDRLYDDLRLMLGDPFASRLAHQWQDETASPQQKAHSLLEQLMRAPRDDEVILIVLDGLEKALDETGQVADEGLRMLLEACLRAGGPVRLIVTSRQEWPLPDDIAHYARWLKLDRGMPEREAITLLRWLDFDGSYGLRDADEELLLRTAQKTEGVPFSLYRIVGLLRKRGPVLPEILDNEELFQEEVTLALAEEMYEHLSPSEQRVIDVLAIYGRPVPEVAVAFALAEEADLATVEGALTELENAFLATRSSAGTWAVHGMDAEIACLRLSAEEQAALHRRAGEFYKQSPDERDRLEAARHFLQARDYARAVPLATRDVQARINQFQASELRQVLNEFTGMWLTAEQQAEVDLARGDVHAFLGERDLAEEGYKGALSHLEALPTSPAVRERRAKACRGMARLLANEAPDEALAWLRRALDELAGASALEEAKVFTRMGSVLILQDEYGEAVKALEEGLRLLPEGSDDLRARVLGNLGVAWCSQGDLGRGGEYFQQALEIFQRSQNRWGEVGALHNLGMIKEYTGDWGGAATLYQEALEVAEQLGDVERQVELESSLGILQMKRGNYDSALVHLSMFLELATSHLKQQRVYAYASLADLRMRRGELVEAEASLGEAEKLALEMPARSRLPEIYRLRAEARLARGDVHTALDLAQQAVSVAREIEGLDPLEEGTSLRVLGQALLADAQNEPAAEAFERSLALLEDRDDYEAARTRAQWGRALLCGGDLEGGTELLQEVQAKFEELDAQRDLAVVRDLLEAE